jgi:hypothetical protein
MAQSSTNTILSGVTSFRSGVKDTLSFNSTLVIIQVCLPLTQPHISPLAMVAFAQTLTGVWPFHCHIAWHVSAGLLTQFLTEPDKVEKLRIPNVVAETCRQWGHWTLSNIPVQIDSGL